MTDSTTWIPYSVREFADLPLGARFRYLRGEEVWVKLGGADGELIARWEGVDRSPELQQVGSFGPTPAQRVGAFVFLAEGSTDAMPLRCTFPACNCPANAQCADREHTRWPRMHLGSKPGERVIYTDRNASDEDLEHCRRAGLVRAGEYEIAGIDVFESSALVHLKGYPGWRFNTACFWSATREANRRAASGAAAAVEKQWAGLVIPVEANEEGSSAADALTQVTRSQESRFRYSGRPQLPRERLVNLVLALSDAAFVADEGSADEMVRELTGGSTVYCPGAYSVDTLRVVAAWLRHIIRRSDCEQRLQLAAARCYGCPGARCFCEVRQSSAKE